MVKFTVEYDTVRITCDNFGDDPPEFRGAVSYVTHNGWQLTRSKMITNDRITMLFTRQFDKPNDR